MDCGAECIGKLYVVVDRLTRDNFAAKRNIRRLRTANVLLAESVIMLAVATLILNKRCDDISNRLEKVENGGDNMDKKG